MAGGYASDGEDGLRDGDPALVVDVVGFEGPLDLLLDLARRQKVDLHEISVLALVDQYLAFIEHARALRLELAADYLVMAAWLAYLKSRLLLPAPPKGEEPSAADLAAGLAHRLRRLEAIRAAARLLEARERLGRDVFGRGHEPPLPRGEPVFEASIFDLLSAYARQRQKTARSHVVVARRPVWSLVDAREAVERLVGGAADWVTLDSYLLRFIVEPSMRPTVIASALSAALELVKDGKARLRQDGAYAPLMVRQVQAEAAAA